MLKYQNRSDYKGIKRAADNFYKSLRGLLVEFHGSSDETKREKALNKLNDLYKEIKETKLYNERGGLYCAILEDANRGI